MDTIREYQAYLRSSGKLGASDTYICTLNTFASWLMVRGKSIETCTSNDIEQFVRTRNTGNSSKMALAAIKGYFKWVAGSYQMGDPRVLDSTLRSNQIGLIAPKKQATVMEKVSLTPREFKMLLNRLDADGASDQLYSGVITQFYFGWRPIEGEQFLSKAKIRWNDNAMIIKTAKKGGEERYLPWHDVITPYLETWYNHTGSITYPGEWLTKKLSAYPAGGLKVTAKTGRKTVETQLRDAEVSDLVIDRILGHTSKTSAIGDVYTDATIFFPKIKDAMENHHYLVPLLL